MYKVIETKGNEEKVLAEFLTLNEAREKAKEIQKKTTVLITVEKDGKIY